ncbi:hypothetical protein RIF29_26401 [Crotalaria pallida]|uniref:DUF4283 domain-containing protein n=1 Tax=Crotalaria pallida TaxID=3830 RepID=A0AAN9I1N9_CROPI
MRGRESCESACKEQRQRQVWWQSSPKGTEQSKERRSYKKTKHGGRSIHTKELDRFGKRFGFVRFFKHNDIPRIQNKLKDFWIGSYKLIINRPRFQREANNKGLTREWNEQHHLNETDELMLKLNQTDKNKLQGAWRKPLISKEVMGHLDESNNSQVVEVHCQQEDLFKTKERLSWVSCYGVPIHAWPNSSMSQVFSLVGSLVTLDLNTSKRKRLDVARGLIIAMKSFSRIDTVLKVKIGTNVYDICFMKESIGDTPLKIDDDRSEGVVESSSDE